MYIFGNGRSRGSGTWKWRNSSFTQPKCTLSQHESLRWEKESAVWMNSLRVVRKALLTYRLQFERKIAETGWPAQTHLIIWWLLLWTVYSMLIIGNPNNNRVTFKSYPCGRWFQAHHLVFHHGTWTKSHKMHPQFVINSWPQLFVPACTVDWFRWVFPFVQHPFGHLGNVPV